jgi:hypothetical protein
MWSLTALRRQISRGVETAQREARLCRLPVLVSM